ncbi:MAG: YtfJ family protein [Halioglobus sp.]
MPSITRTSNPVTAALLGVILLALAVTARAEAPETLPELVIADRGELLMDGEDFSYATWRSDANPGTIHVLQYFGGTMSDSKTFEPFTDLLQASLEPGMVHVTTIINMDAATWGTSGFVVSELKKNKKMHPESTMVLDEEGVGVKQWNLGKDGTGLFIVDTQGQVLFFSADALTEEELQGNLDLIKAASAS